MAGINEQAIGDRGVGWRSLGLTLAGVAVLTVAAKVQIPFWPVPMTLHILAVMAISAYAGPRLAVATMLGYLMAGALGLPVFAGTPERGIGLAYMMGPTGGYLLGFVVAAWLVARLAKNRQFAGRFAAMLVGLAVIYALGAAWLAKFVPFDQVFALGVAPFVLGDVIKAGIAALLGSALPLARALGRGDKA